MPLSDAQKAERRSGIGGSDAAAVCGRHPTKSPLDVWLQKVYGVEQKSNAAMEWGQRLERVIAEAAAEELGMTLAIPTETIRHPLHPWALANLDGKLNGDRVLETKCINGFAARELGPPGSDGVMRAALYQVHHYLAVTGLQTAHVAYLINGIDLRLFRVERDEDFIAALLEIEGEFWHDCVLKTEPPDEGTVSAWDQYLRTIHPKDDGSTLTIEAPGVALAALTELRDARLIFRSAETRKEEAESAVKRMMGAATKIESPLGYITWKQGKKARQFLPRFSDEPEIIDAP